MGNMRSDGVQLGKHKQFVRTYVRVYPDDNIRCYLRRTPYKVLLYNI